MANREIKFRAWVESIINEETGMYYDITILMGIDGKAHKVWTDEYKFKDDVCKITLLQYTGLKDRKGKEIYEGDILDIKNWGVVEVIWNEDCACLGMKTEDEKYPFVMFDNNEGSYFDREIIGNIYKNKELLNGK